jgi:hypothetical protein
MRKLMEYHIVSGRTVETRRTWLPSGPTERKKRGTRRAGTSSLKKIKANERSCALNLGRTINCNFEAGDWFLALKYDDSHYPASQESDPVRKREEEFQAAKRILTKKFLPRLRQAYQGATGKKLKAVWVTANWSTKQKHFTRIHHHMVIPADALYLAQTIWKQIGGLNGTMQAECLNGEGDYSRVAAYMVDNVQGRPAGENRWSGCRGMAKPVCSDPIEVRDVESIEPLQDEIVKEVVEYTDEDGRVISKYMRGTLPDRVVVRGGQIVLPKRRRRKAG